MPGPASFLAATLFEPTGPGRYRGRFDAGWYQGRGAFGGVVGGATLRAMAHAVAAPARAVRSLTVHFCAPAVEGEAEVQVRVERAGRRVTHVTARTEAAGGTVCVASASFCAEQPTEVAYLRARPPEAPPPEALAPVPVESLPPPFSRHFEYRFCEGGLAAPGALEAAVGGWVRPRVPTLLDAPLVLGLIDAYPPSMLSGLEAMRPGASVDLTVLFFPVPREVEGTREAFFLRTARSRWAAGGYAEDFQELWTESGVLLAQCRQLIAVLG